MNNELFESFKKSTLRKFTKKMLVFVKQIAEEVVEQGQKQIEEKKESYPTED